MKTAVAPDGTVQIPKLMVQALGLKAGAELDCELDAGRVIVQPVASSPASVARRIRERARRWKLAPCTNAHAESEERRREFENDRREGRA